MSQFDLTLVSCLELPEPDPDASPLAEALTAAGLRHRVLGWDDPQADWSESTLTLFRSCWNYPWNHEAFLAWIAGIADRTHLCNPLPAVRWNMHKGYLLDLERNGLPVTPTVLLYKGDGRSLVEVMDAESWDEVVVKPAISAGSYKTLKVDRETLAQGEAHLAELIPQRDMLVQPYLKSVEDYGERALVWIDGKLTHAVRKSPRMDGQDESVSEASIPIAEAEGKLAKRVMRVLNSELLYARIDVAPGPDGEPLLMELELVEPSLFFPQSPEALDRFVTALAAKVRGKAGAGMRGSD